jgi:hypothetical protein
MGIFSLVLARRVAHLQQSPAPVRTVKKAYTAKIESTVWPTAIAGRFTFASLKPKTATQAGKPHRAVGKVAANWGY